MDRGSLVACIDVSLDCAQASTEVWPALLTPHVRSTQSKFPTGIATSDLGPGWATILGASNRRGPLNLRYSGPMEDPGSPREWVARSGSGPEEVRWV